MSLRTPSYPVVENFWIAKRRAILSATVLSSLLAFPAHAAMKVETGNAMPHTRFQQKPMASSSDPVLLNADAVNYDHDHNTVSATGHVEVVQGETVVLADELIYDRDADKMIAKGHVSMLEPSGNVYFSDALEVQNSMKTGVVEQFKGRLSDNSLLVATQANKVDENKLELFKAAYTPCDVCTPKGKAKSPLWQITADHITVDDKQHEVIYDDAYFKVKGVPVLYSPYFSHATPGADNQTGFLMPEYQHSDNLGSVFRVPVYYVIGKDKDVTLTPIYTTSEGLVMAGEYRQLFDAGPLFMAGSLTSAQKIDAQGNDLPGHELRGDISGNGKFTINDTYDWGFNFHRVTDDTYLGRYGFDNETLLTSRVFAEGSNFKGTNERSYGIVQALAFQGLGAQDNSKLIPLVAPLADVSFQSDPGIYGSRFTFDGDAMALYRQQGADSRRLSGTVGWKLPYISPGGQVIEFNAQMRTDIYSVNDVMLSPGNNYRGVTGREIPQISALWRYPFIKQGENSSVMIEPVVNLTVSPSGGNPGKIPNEDSLVPEFTDSNLFDNNRFAGLDRVESGPRISYGLRGQAQFNSDKYVDWLFGQQYRVDNDPNFPITNDLDSHLSDYVGKVGVNYLPFSIAYRFRLDRDNLSPKRSEVDGGFNYYPVSFNLSYLSLRDDPILATRQQIVGTANLNLTKEWMWTVTADRDLLLNEFVTTGMGLTYQNECTNVSTLIGREYTLDRDIKPSTTFLMRVSLKNLD